MAEKNVLGWSDILDLTNQSLRVALCMNETGIKLAPIERSYLNVIEDKSGILIGNIPKYIRYAAKDKRLAKRIVARLKAFGMVSVISGRAFYETAEVDDSGKGVKNDKSTG